MKHTSNTTKFIPLTKWPEYHPWPTVQGLRYYVFNGDLNGFDQVIHRVGRRILIDEAAFFDWITAKGGKNVSR